MGHGLDPIQEAGASRGDAQNNQTSAFNPSRVSPCLMVIRMLDLEDLKAPYLSTSMFEIVRNGGLFGYLPPESYLD